MCSSGTLLRSLLLFIRQGMALDMVDLAKNYDKINNDKYNDKMRGLLWHQNKMTISVT